MAVQVEYQSSLYVKEKKPRPQTISGYGDLMEKDIGEGEFTMSLYYFNDRALLADCTPIESHCIYMIRRYAFMESHYTFLQEKVIINSATSLHFVCVLCTYKEKLVLGNYPSVLLFYIIE